MHPPRGHVCRPQGGQGAHWDGEERGQQSVRGRLAALGGLKDRPKQDPSEQEPRSRQPTRRVRDRVPRGREAALVPGGAGGPRLRLPPHCALPQTPLSQAAGTPSWQGCRLLGEPRVVQGAQRQPQSTQKCQDCAQSSPVCQEAHLECPSRPAAHQNGSGLLADR